jgi:citrate lyase subunit beta/citryl-CoA lyase
MLTWLYVPGDRPDRFPKAIASGADVVILDLEDAVAAARKRYARDAVVEFLADVPTVPCEVRVNDPGDADVLAGLPGLHSLRVPKAETARQLAQYARVAPGIPLQVLIETAAGVENAAAIATAPAVATISPGEADLGSDLGITSEDGFAWARGRLVIAARAAGLPAPAMSVYPTLNDDEGLRRSCTVGRSQGMRGRAAIHPQQVPVIVDAFRPTARETRRAEELLAAFAAAAKDGSGTAVLPDGRFADRAMLGAAQAVVELAKRFGMAS